jgi:hypothetical protein
MPVFARTRATSRLAVAVALAAATGVVGTSPAVAQKKQEQPAQRKAEFSKGFRAAYGPLEASIKASDYPTIKPAIPALIAAAQTADDKFVAGQTAYLAGSKTGDKAMEVSGLELMLSSGLAEPKQTAAAAHRLGELALEAKDFATAQARAQQAIAAGDQLDAELLYARALIGQNQAQAGLERLDRAIAAQIARGQPVPESWLKFGIANAEKARLTPQSLKYAAMWAQYYPSGASWADTIAIHRNAGNYEAQEHLDLLRLAARANALRSERDYIDYLAAADARRLPGETQRIIDAGVRAGLLNRSNQTVAEAAAIAAERVKADEAALPSLARDARQPSADAKTLMAAGDAFLSYGKSAEAEEFYTLALTKPGVDTPRALTRLAIAQLDLGKTTEAQANFARVEGARQAIAGLWSVYAAQAAHGASKPAQ